MLTLDDIVNASFGKAGFSAGYRTDDVDDFIDEVKESYEELLHKYAEQREAAENAKKENLQLSEKIDVLVDCVEKYRTEENDIKSVLVDAHKTADASIKDAKQKSETILAEAKTQSETMLREAKIKSDIMAKEAEEKAAVTVEKAKAEAESTISSIDSKVEEKQRELAEIEEAVSSFKSMLIRTYKEHITLIQSLPVKEAPEKAEKIEKSEIKAEEETKPEPVAKPVSEPAKEEKISQPAEDEIYKETESEAVPEAKIETKAEEKENEKEPFAQQQFMTKGIPNLSDIKNNENFHSYDFNEYNFEEEEEEEEEEESRGLFGKRHKKKK